MHVGDGRKPMHITRKSSEAGLCGRRGQGRGGRAQNKPIFLPTRSDILTNSRTHPHTQRGNPTHSTGPVLAMVGGLEPIANGSATNLHSILGRASRGMCLPSFEIPALFWRRCSCSSNRVIDSSEP